MYAVWDKRIYKCNYKYQIYFVFGWSFPVIPIQQRGSSLFWCGPLSCSACEKAFSYLHPCVLVYLTHTGYLTVTLQVIENSFWLVRFFKIFLTWIILNWYLQKFDLFLMIPSHVCTSCLGVNWRDGSGLSVWNLCSTA